MKVFAGRTAVITGAASGFGLEFARSAARLGMNVVMADVQADALAAAVAEIESMGVAALARRVDVSKAGEVEALGVATTARFGAPHLVFNNAGVGASGLVWEHPAKDWEWVMGVNVMGVAHGVRVFTPLMLAAAKVDASYEGHIVNTASMAGLVNNPLMGVYNASKHAVVALSETLHQDLALVSEQVHASVLCPYFVPTGIGRSERNRPLDGARTEPLTKAQRVGQAMTDKAVGKGKVSAAEVAQFVFDAIAERRFYIFSHPRALGIVAQRIDAVVEGRNPGDPFEARPEVGHELRAALRDG